MLLLSLKILLLLSPATLADTGKEFCSVVEIQAGEYHHDFTTSYDGTDSLGLLGVIHGRLKPAEKERFRRFDFQAVVAGKESLLSLGEGDSDIVAKLIQERAKRSLPIDDVVALDPVYRNRDAVVNRVGTEKESSRPYHNALVKAHPENYVAQTFGKIDLTSADGERRKFHNIVSFMSLCFVLRKSSPEAIKGIFRNLALHAEKGATLWSDGGGASREELVKITKALSELKSEGVIADYSEPDLESGADIGLGQIAYRDEYVVRFP